MKFLSLVLVFCSSVVYASPQVFVCDMRNIAVDKSTSGLYRLRVDQDEAVLYAGVSADQEVATLSPTKSLSKSSTVFAHADGKDRVEQSFDLLASGDTGILIWRYYDWQNPDSLSPINSTVHICHKK